MSLKKFLTAAIAHAKLAPSLHIHLKAAGVAAAARLFPHCGYQHTRRQI